MFDGPSFDPFSLIDDGFGRTEVGVGGLHCPAYHGGVAENDWVLQTLAVLTIPFSLIASYASGVFLGRQRIAAFRKISWRPALLRLVLIVLLCWVVSLGAYGALMAGLAASALGAGYALWLLAKETPLRIRLDREAAVMLQRRGFAFAVSLFALTVNYKIMVLLLTAFGTLTDVGLYVQATVIAELIWEVPTIIGSLVLSRGVNAKDQDLFSHKVLVLARISLLAAAAAAIVIAVISPYAFPLLFGPEFAGSATLCNILLPGVAAFIVFKTLNMDLAARGKPWVASLVVGPALLINIGLGWWMIERYGATGAAITSTLCFVGASIAYVIAYSRVTGIGLRPMLCYRRSDFEIVLRQLPIGRRAA